MFPKDRCCFVCQRAVHIYLKVPVALHSSLFFDLPDKIQHFLCTSYSKRRNHQISSPVKGSLNNLTEKTYIVRSVSMASVTISGFHDYIICLVKPGRIFDQRLICISNIPGKNNFFLCVLFCDRNLNTCRSQKMPRIYKPYLNSLCRLHCFFIRTGNKIPDHSHCIFHSIRGNKFRLALAASLTVSPLSLKHLYMSAVAKHNVAKIAGGICGINRSLKAFGINCRKITGMIHMSMGQQHKINISRISRNIPVFIIIRPLLHTTVYQKLFSRRFQIVAASCHFVRCTDKCNLHMQAPFVRQSLLNWNIL